MPLIHGFKATTIFRAFILNSLASATVIFVALIVKGHFDTFQDEKGHQITRTTNLKSMLLTFTLTFIATFIAYSTLYFVFGFGGGMIANQ